MKFWHLKDFFFLRYLWKHIKCEQSTGVITVGAGHEKRKDSVVQDKVRSRDRTRETDREKERVREILLTLEDSS